MQRQTRQTPTAALLEIANEISSSHDLNDCLNRICHITSTVLQADRSHVTLWSGRKRGFVAAADVGTPPDVFERFRGTTLSLGSAYMDQLASGQIAIVDRDAADPAATELLDALRLATQLIAPFTITGGPTGALIVGYEALVHPTADDLDLLRGLAQQAAIAIRTTRLVTNAQKAAEFRAAVSELAIVLSRERDLDTGIHQVCEKAHAAFGVDGAMVAVREQETLVVRGATGADTSNVLHRSVSVTSPASVSAQVFREGRAVAVNQYRDSAYHSGPLLAGMRIEAALIAPMVLDGQTLGVLILTDATETHRFSRIHVEEATILAATAGAWIHNNQLLTALREEGIKLAEHSRRLEQVNRALAYKSAEVENANRALEDLIYVASHDLRAPLINLSGFAHELGMQVRTLRSHLNGTATAVADEMEESVGFIRAAAARLDTLVQGLLDLSRCGMREIVLEPVNLDALVAGVLDGHRFALTSANIDIAVAALPTVLADPVGLQQVFGNLISNAIKYMGPAPRRLIEIGYDEADEHRFFVRDSGPGIDRREHAKIFRLFHRTSPAAVPGDGVGLAVVKKIVERHGGKVGVQSRPGDGALFWFTLPKATAAATG